MPIASAASAASASSAGGEPRPPPPPPPRPRGVWEGALPPAGAGGFVAARSCAQTGFDKFQRRQSLCRNHE